MPSLQYTDLVLPGNQREKKSEDKKSSDLLFIKNLELLRPIGQVAPTKKKKKGGEWVWWRRKSKAVGEP